MYIGAYSRDPNSLTREIVTEFRAQCRFHVYSWIPRDYDELHSFTK